MPYSAFDKLQRVSHAAIVENKRLGEVLAWIKERQDSQPRFKRIPAGPRRSDQKAGPMKTRALRITEAAKSALKSSRRRRRRSDTMSARRRLPSLDRPPRDISTLQKSRHLNLVATRPLGRCPLKVFAKRYRKGYQRPRIALRDR